MLLNEDDLQAAIDYTVAKRKLTNRYVIGAGVVCGLDVTPDRCDPRVVVVSPGYAIECCGNDILVTCPEVVDIIDLVRELRQRTGVDCGEPCDEQPRQEYHLYIRYAETPTAPVAPYAPDDCATGECEFSRISEGYRFELRCDGTEDTLTLIDALRACRPADDRVKREVADMGFLVQTLNDRDAIKRRIASSAEAVVSAPTVAEFTRQVDELGTLPEAERLDKSIQLVKAVVVAHAQRTAVDPPSERRLTPVAKTVVEGVRELAVELRASPALAAMPQDDQKRLNGLLAAAMNPGSLEELSAAERGWLALGTSVGVANEAFVATAASIRDVVLRGLAEQGESGSAEYHEVTRMSFDSLAGASERDVIQLGRTYVRLVEGCACSVFNPPCPTCTEDAVELASVRVDGCEVVDVCTLDRRWVLSPRAVSYWYPVVERVRGELERMCCDDDDGAKVERRLPFLFRDGASRIGRELGLASGADESRDLIAKLQDDLADANRRLEALAGEKAGQP
jgi:hypothetical protein